MPHKDKNQPTSVKLITSIIKRSFFVAQTQSYGAVNVPLIAESIYRVKPLSQVVPLEFSMFFGLGDDSSDGEEIEWFLASVDASNIPDVGSIRGDNYWSAIEHWTTVGTPGIIYNTVQHVIEDFLNPVPFANLNLETRERAQVMALITSSRTVTANTILATGLLTIEEVLIQRRWGGDNTTFTSWTSKELKDGLLAEEWECGG